MHKYIQLVYCVANVAFLIYYIYALAEECSIEAYKVRNLIETGSGIEVDPGTWGTGNVVKVEKKRVPFLLPMPFYDPLARVFAWTEATYCRVFFGLAIPVTLFIIIPMHLGFVYVGFIVIIFVEFLILYNYFF